MKSGTVIAAAAVVGALWFAGTSGPLNNVVVYDYVRLELNETAK